MVIVAWIVFIILVGFVITNFILCKKNEGYRNKINRMLEKKWTIVVTAFLTHILIYTIVTSFLIMVQGDCFVGYYCGNFTIVIDHHKIKDTSEVYYNGEKYMLITYYEKELLDRAYKYGAGEWEYTDTYIMWDRPVNFPYFEYWCPKFYRGEIIVPGDKEPVYIRVKTKWSSNDYIRYDRWEEWIK